MNLTDLNGWADQWASRMLQACWHGALAVAGVWLICRLFPRLPASLRTALWWLACLKTLASLVITGPLPVAVLPAEAPPVLAAAPTPAAVAPTSIITRSPSWGTAVINAALIPTEIGVAPAPREKSPAVPISPLSVVLVLWLIGVLFLVVALIREWGAVRRLAEQADPCDKGPAIQEVSRAVGLTRSPRVLVSERADTSLVVGPWRPAVVLCQADMERLSPDELRALLAHELAHVQRKDLWAGILPNLARLLFYFNPLVWLACREYDLAREAACDAEALRVSGLAPADYGRLLLKLSIRSNSLPQYTGMATLGVASPYGILLRRRLTGLKRLGKGSRWTSVIALAVVLGVLSLNPVRVGARTAPSVPAAATLPTVAERGRPTAPKPSRERLEKFARKDSVAAKPAVEEASLLSLLLPPAFLSSRELPANSRIPAVPNASPSNPNTHKEVQPVLKLSNERKLKPSALAAVALATAGMSNLFAAPSTAQDAPVAPVPPVPPVASAAPVVIPAIPAIPAVPAVPAVPYDIQDAPVNAQTMRYQFTLRQGDSYMNHTRDQAISKAQRELAKAQPGDCLVVDRDGKRYLITDAATLKKIKDSYAPVDAIGKQMEAKGKEMETTIGKEMEALGKQMGEVVGKQMEALGKQLEEQGKLLEAAIEGGKSEADQKAIHERMKELQDQMKVPQEQMRVLGEKMKEHGAKMRPLGDQMRALGNQIRTAVKEAEEKVNGIIDDAFKNNLAVEQK